MPDDPKRCRSAPCRGMTSHWQPRRSDFTPDPGLPLLERILQVRGQAADAETFLNPSLRGLHDPSLIPDLDRAAARLLEALKLREPIAIYGDYDVDGITATAILYRTLRSLMPDADVRTYVPHRLDEGYGLNAAALEQLAAEGARVVISVDCGITARAPAAAARAAGLDLIITDHHNPPVSMDDLPDAMAIVHPRRPDSTYPYDHLSGAGVAYKLAWRLATMHCASPRITEDLRELLLELLAFAALGSIADVMPLTGENRIIARFGLVRIKHSTVPGLRALVQASGLAKENIDSEHVGFALGPRLNACGRMGHAREAVELFTTAEGDRADEIARELCRLNDRRRSEERRIADHAARVAVERGMTTPDRRAIVLAHEDWHPGIVGIVCSRLVARFCRPTILMQRREGQCQGSGRSIEGFNLHNALADCSEHLLTYGGHDMAAGLRLDERLLDQFVDAFTAHANQRISDEALMPMLTYDCEASLAELTPQAVHSLDAMAPFGTANPRPRLRLRNLRIERRPQRFGQSARHISLLVRSPGLARTVRIVAWNWEDSAGPSQLEAGVPIEVIVCPKVSTWNGQVEPQLEDLMILEPAGVSA